MYSDCDESETDESGESEYDLTDASSVSSDDMEGGGGFDSDEFELGPITKRRRL